VGGGERGGGREEGVRDVFFCTEIPEGTIMFCCLKSRRGVDGEGGPRKSMYTKYYFDRRRKEVIRGGGMVENFGLETPSEHTIDRHGNRPPQRVEGQRAHPFFQVVQYQIYYINNRSADLSRARYLIHFRQYVLNLCPRVQLFWQVID